MSAVDLNVADVEFVKELYPRLREDDSAIERYRAALDLIDAKGGNGPRYAIETRSLEAADAFVAHLLVPVFFVAADGGVLTPRDVHERGRPGPVTQTTGGTGTPYVLVEKNWARKFNDVFGEPTAQEVAA